MKAIRARSSRRIAAAAVGIAFIAALILAVAWIGGFAGSFSGSSGSAGAFDADLRLAVFDVGQAQAVGIIAGDGDAMLIDTGRSGERLEETIIPYLHSHDVSGLRYLVLSHPDQDHIGGTPAMLRAFPVETLVDPVIPTTNQTYGEALSLGLELDIDALVARRGDELAFSDGVTVEVLWPDEPFLEVSGEVDSNENSVVLRIVFGDFEILIPGDIGTRAERQLVDRDDGSLQSDVLVVPHHGSAGSSSGPFLDAVDPDVAIISAGFDNQYGHPADEVIRRLRMRAIDIYRTDLDGTIEIQSDGRELRIDLVGTEEAP